MARGPPGVRARPSSRVGRWDIRPAGHPAVIRRRPRRHLRQASCAGSDRSRLDLAEARRQSHRVAGAPEAPQPGEAMRVAGLLLVFVFAKVMVLAPHHVTLSSWSPIAYFWQDAAVVLVFAAMECCVGARAHVAWVTYAALA